MARKVTIRDVITATSLVTGVDFGELIGHRRDHALVEAREIVALVSMRRTRSSFPDIAEAMGRSRRSHASIIERYRRAANRDAKAERCNEFARLVDRVNDLISERQYQDDVAAECRRSDK